MALKSWLASLKADVLNVSGVQVPIHAGLVRYVIETADVSSVSESGGMVASDTADTVGNLQAFQTQPAWTLACTVDTGDTCKKTKADIQTTEAPTSPTQTGANHIQIPIKEPSPVTFGGSTCIFMTTQLKNLFQIL